MESNRHDILKLRELIQDYINNKKYSGSELSSKIIDGEDLVNVLDNLNLPSEKDLRKYEDLKVNYEERNKEYKELKENYDKLEEKYDKLEAAYNENLTKDISRLIKGKEGPFIDKIKRILEE